MKCLPWVVWLSCLEYHPVDQKFMGLIPGQGTYEKTTNQCFPLIFIFPLPPLSTSPTKEREKMPLDEDRKIKFAGCLLHQDSGTLQQSLPSTSDSHLYPLQQYWTYPPFRVWKTENGNETQEAEELECSEIISDGYFNF